MPLGELLRGDNTWVYSVAFSPDNKTLARLGHRRDATQSRPREELGPHRASDIAVGGSVGISGNLCGEVNRISFVQDDTAQTVTLQQIGHTHRYTRLRDTPSFAGPLYQPPRLA
jgi:hypothetical protein